MLKVYLVVERGDAPYADVARTLGLTATAVKVAVHRLRDKYRQAIRQLVADTVDEPSEIDRELDEILSLL